MNNQNKNKNLSERLSKIEQRLASEAQDKDSLVAVADEFQQLSIEAGKTAHDVVQQGADLLVLVSELAANWDSAENEDTTRDRLIEFLGDGVVVLDAALVAGDEDNVNALIEMAKDTWPEYFTIFGENEFGGDTFESQWGNDVEEEAEVAADAGQIALMLQALSSNETSQNYQETVVGAVDQETVPSASDGVAEGPQTTPDGPSSEQQSEEDKLDSIDFIATPDKGGDEVASKQLADDPEMLEAYLDDALRCVASMEQAALAIEQDASDREPVRQFCRELHTLKGASATVGLSELASTLHELESSLEQLFRDEQAKVNADPLFTAVDQVRAMIGGLRPTGVTVESTEDSPVEPGNPIPQRSPSDFASFTSNDNASVRIRASNLDRLMDMLAELVVLRNRQESDVQEFSELNEELTRCSSRVSVADDVARLQQAMFENNDLVDLAMLQSSQPSADLSEVSKDITAVSQGLRDLQKPIIQNNAAISQFIRDFRHELMRLRRVPVTGMFNRLQRAARDAAKTEQKKILVQMSGENAGLEQEIQERLFESLLHVVRNSVSHGIESESDRTKAGKKPVGTIFLEASSNAQLLIIEVRDDGAGIDYEAVRRRATEKGLLVPGQEVSEGRLGKLIFHPGFSTKQTASAVSGRGVGMDIVATTVEQLKGRIEVDSIRGEGTKIRILIPLKSGIEHVMVFRAGDQLFGLPMQAVSSAKRANGSNAVSVSGVFGLDTLNSGEEGDILHVRRAGTAGSKDTSVKSLAVHVDELIGPEEVVVRKLPNLLVNHPVFNGVTLSGSGKKVLLLNAEQFAVHCERSTDSLTDSSNLPESDRAEVDQKRVLVVDDSLTARRAMSKMMRSKGFQVVEAGDGIQAIEILRRQTFDLVLTDLDMPKMGGLELLLDIQSGRYCNAAKAVVSSRDEQTFREQVAEAGADDYITKPITERSVERLLGNLGLLSNSKGNTNDE